MSKQNEMMAKALKEYMQMKADDIEEVHEIMLIEDVKTKNARQDKYIEDTLNNVFARNMPELHEQEELGMGFGKERILNEVIREADANGTFDVVFDCENKELKEIWMDDELGKADPEVQKRLIEIMLTRKIKPKGETKLKKSLKRLTNHVYREYGARCDEYEPTCIVCKTWACIDHLKETIKLKGETNE